MHYRFARQPNMLDDEKHRATHLADVNTDYFSHCSRGVLLLKLVDGGWVLWLFALRRDT